MLPLNTVFTFFIAFFLIMFRSDKNLKNSTSFIKSLFNRWFSFLTHQKRCYFRRLSGVELYSGHNRTWSPLFPFALSVTTGVFSTRSRPPVTRRATSSSSCAREDWHVHVFLPNARRQAAGPPDTRPSARPRSGSLLPPARPRSTASSAPFLTHDFSPSRSCRILCLRTWLRFRSPRVLRPAPARGGPRFFL